MPGVFDSGTRVPGFWTSRVWRGLPTLAHVHSFKALVSSFLLGPSKTCAMDGISVHDWDTRGKRSGSGGVPI
jgi:hypothetical protein